MIVYESHCQKAIFPAMPHFPWPFLLDELPDLSLCSLPGFVRHSGSTKRHQQTPNRAHAGADAAHQHCLPVLLHPAPVPHAHQAGLPEHVLHRHLLPQPRRGGHPRRRLQPLRQQQNRRGLLPRPWAKGEHLSVFWQLVNKWASHLEVGMWGEELGEAFLCGTLRSFQNFECRRKFLICW